MSSRPLDAASTSGAQRERAVIATSCTPLRDQTTAQSTAQPQTQITAICRALNSTLAALAPTAVVRTLADLAEAPSRPGDFAIALRLAAPSDDHIKGALEWRQGTPPWQNGETLRIDVMDSTLTPAMVLQFAENLLKVTPELARALRMSH